MSKPSLSVICPTYNGALKLPGLIKCLSKNLERSQVIVEIIFVIDGSKDNSAEIIEKFAEDFPLTAIICQNNKINLGASEARNIGVSLSHSETIAFIDDDCRPISTWMGDLIQSWKVSPKEMLGLGGVVKSHDPVTFNQKYCEASTPLRPYQLKNNNESIFRRLISYYSESIQQRSYAKYFAGCNMTFRKSAFVEAGGFDPAMKWGGEDAFICSQIRKKFGHNSLVIDPNLVMPHEFSMKFSGSIWRSYAYGRASGRASRKNGITPSFNPGPLLLFFLSLSVMATSIVFNKLFLSVANFFLISLVEITLYTLFLLQKKIIVSDSILHKFIYSLAFFLCETANMGGFVLGFLISKKELVYKHV
jgi:glycosyltransferase involved in cell wall biosynthesis